MKTPSKTPSDIGLKIRTLFFPAVLSMIGSGLIGCAPAGHLTTSSGKPEIVVRNANWKTAWIAIAEYNMSKGRKLDRVVPNELVLYEAVPSSDGTEQVVSKTVYDITLMSDSIMISSHHYLTEDLDDSDVSEADDQATYDAEQQELTQIAANIASDTQNLAAPTYSR